MHNGMRLWCVLGMVGQVALVQGQAPKDPAGEANRASKVEPELGDTTTAAPATPAPEGAAAPIDPVSTDPALTTPAAANPVALPPAATPVAVDPASPDGVSSESVVGKRGFAPLKRFKRSSARRGKVAKVARFVPGPAAVAMFGGILGRRDEGFARVNDGLSAVQFGLLASYDVYANSVFRLAAEAGWGVSGGERSSLLGGEVRGEYTEHRLLGGLVLSGPLFKSIWPHLRVSGGVSRLAVELSETSGASQANGFAVDDALWLPLGEVALGTSVLFPMGKRWKFALLIRGELGYGFSRRKSLSLSGTGENVQVSDLGSLHLAGAFGRVAFGVRL